MLRLRGSSSSHELPTFVKTEDTHWSKEPMMNNRNLSLELALAKQVSDERIRHTVRIALLNVKSMNQRFLCIMIEWYATMGDEW